MISGAGEFWLWALGAWIAACLIALAFLSGGQFDEPYDIPWEPDDLMAVADAVQEPLPISPELAAEVDFEIWGSELGRGVES